MKLLVESKPNYWKVEFITSSSKEVVRSTILAGDHTLAPKAISRSSVDFSDCNKFARAPRHSRCRNIRRRFSTFISYFQCGARQNKMISEEQQAYPESLKLDTGMNNRSAFELPGSGVEIYQTPVNMSHIPWYECSIDAELPSATAELSTHQFVKPLYELDGGISSFTTAQPLMRPVSPFTTSIESCAQVTPAMSPQTISQKSSPISPNTPTTIHDAARFQRKCASFDVAVSPDETITFSDHYGTHEPLAHEPVAHEMPVNFSFSGLDQLAFDGFFDEIGPPMSDMQWMESNYQQGNNRNNQLPIHPMAFRAGLQQAIASTSCSLTLEGSTCCHNALLGTWESTDDLIWTQVRDDEPAHHVNAKAISTYPTEQREWPPVKCEHCKEEFTGRYAPGNMRRHSQKHRLDTKMVYKCSLCDNSYKRSDALRHHERRKHPHSAIVKPRKRSTRMLGLLNT